MNANKTVVFRNIQLFIIQKVMTLREDHPALWPCVPRRDLVQDIPDLVSLDGLGNVSVHSLLPALVLYTVQYICRHSDDDRPVDLCHTLYRLTGGQSVHLCLSFNRHSVESPSHLASEGPSE